MSGTWAANWAIGDVLTAAEFKKGAGCIYDTTLGGSAANIDITSIVGTYAHLRIILDARGTDTATNSALWLRFNNTTGAGYYYQQQEAYATTSTAIEGLGQGQIVLGEIPAANAPANTSSPTVIEIPNYAGTTFAKTCVAHGGGMRGTTSGLVLNWSVVGFWQVTSAISRVTLLPSAGSFAAGSRCSVYAFGA